MKPFYIVPSGNRRPYPAAIRGFALVVTLSLMILLTVIAVGMLTLGSISLRGADASSAQMTARANARMAMMMALGELQKQVGPDRAVTITSGLAKDPAPKNQNWTGAINVNNVDTTKDPKSEPVTWLVSGIKPDPAAEPVLSKAWNQGDALEVGSYKPRGATAAVKVNAPVMNITRGASKGRYAWWISDEGAKARVDLARSETTPEDREQMARSQAPLENGLVNLGAEWSEFSPGGTVKKGSLISIGTTSLAAKNSKVSDEYFNDLTTGGSGLPTSLAKGGMKADLSLIFDKSQSSKPYGTRYFGANPAKSTINGAAILGFTPSDNSKFFLSNTISKDGKVPAGPNWGILWNYANLWDAPNLNGTEATLIGPNPPNRTDIRFKDWVPYTNSDKANGISFNYRTDKQHTNSALSPVISMLQLSFRLSSERAVPAKPTDPPTFKAQITMQPVFGIWNPYNVSIKAASYVFDWALYPHFVFNYGKPKGNGKFTDPKYTELWLREEWAKGDIIPTSDNPKATSYFSARTEPVDLQPGEFRIFSALDKTVVAPGSGNGFVLKSGWSEKGGFVVNLKDAEGNQRLVPSGYRAWFGNILLQDTQNPNVTKKFPSLDPSTTASTFVCLKAFSPSETILFRATDLWNGDSKSAPLMPEPILSGSSGGVDTTKTTYLIDDLEGDKVMAHIATWSFFSRTTQQVEEESQRLRGWIDTNPRAIASNPAWDGSKVTGSGEKEGWNTTSQLLGVYNPPGKPKQVGDGYGGNRGLLGEGGSSIYEPEMNTSGGRYQGFGGPANSAAGQNNVVLYDVPRGPLVSIGQFQHAELARYNFEPGFVAGNSYANVRIPLDTTVNPNFNGINGFNVVDTSYEVNRRLWDDYYFSTLATDFKKAAGAEFDKVFDFEKLASGETTLPNPRVRFQPLPGDTSIDKIIKDAGDRAPEAIASRTMIEGAFNVNSTSKVAWKAILSSMAASEMPVVDFAGSGSLSWEDPEGIRFNRFGSVINKDPYEVGKDGGGPEFWQGWREISESELDALAEAVTEEVKERGPFRSLAEFINRNPYSTNIAHRRKGALQAALDRTINHDLPSSVGGVGVQPPGAQFSKAFDGENQGAASAGYLLQGDILQSLAPILQARSDYFKIRTCGEAVDSSGKIVARAWCEAFVQRSTEYLDTKDSTYRAPTELTAAANKSFGRRFNVVSFRWLSETEI